MGKDFLGLEDKDMIAVTADTTGASRNVHLYLDVEDEHDWCAFSSALSNHITHTSIAQSRPHRRFPYFYSTPLLRQHQRPLLTLPAQCTQGVWYRKTHSR